MGSINIGQGQFNTDTTDIAQPVPIASTDFNNKNIVELTRDQIASGQVFFSSNPSPDNVGKTVDLEFNVKDSSGDISVVPGLIRISILELHLLLRNLLLMLSISLFLKQNLELVGSILPIG